MAVVYRYVDLLDNTIKYIGIVYGKNRTLQQRVYEHYTQDDWCKNKSWKIEYINVGNRTEAEHFESHFISLYGTDIYFNDAKSKWGISKYLPIDDKEIGWIEFTTNKCDENCDYVDLYEISFKKDIMKFEIKKIKAIRSKCKKKISTNSLFCKRCGGNELILKNNSSNTATLLKCKKCDISIGMCSSYERVYYKPEYVGDYEFKDQKIVEYNRYILKGSYRKSLKDDELNKCLEYRDGTYYAYSLSKDSCKEAFERKIKKDINYTKENIKDIEVKLKQTSDKLSKQENILKMISNM